MASGPSLSDTQRPCMSCAECGATFKNKKSSWWQPKKDDSTCTCNSSASSSECPIASRCQEPLAWSITPTEINDQSTSMLYTLIPREIRDMIFTYALTDTTSYPVDRELRDPPGAVRSRDRYSFVQDWRCVSLYQSDVAFNLLLTCKAVYLETYILPLHINELAITGLRSQVKENRFYSWQLAQIARLDIRLPQMSLENGALRNALRAWKAPERSQGCYVVPREAVILYNVNSRLQMCPNSFENILIPAATTEAIDKRPQRLTDVLRSAQISDPRDQSCSSRLSCRNAQIPQSAAKPCASNFRFSLASRLTHLTLRLGSKDWWTWGDDPSSTDPSRTLRLDPTFEYPQPPRGSSDEMRFLAKERREGRPPILRAECWGTHVTSLLPDLQELKLVLETWEVKVNQLDIVVECAKTWSFDIEEDTLVWDGEVVEKRYQRALTALRMPKDASWNHRCRDHEVRIVRFLRQKK